VNKTRCGVLLVLLLCSNPAHLLSSDLPPLSPLDIFELEWAADPQISPDGKIGRLRSTRFRCRKRSRNLSPLDFRAANQSTSPSDRRYPTAKLSSLVARWKTHRLPGRRTALRETPRRRTRGDSSDTWTRFTQQHFVVSRWCSYRIWDERRRKEA